jgi:hypothetical protein
VSVIQNALIELNAKLEKLEEVATACEERVTTTQNGNGRDLFDNVPVNGNGKDMIDPALLAQKLDTTIERIEQVLKEG